MQTKFVKRAVPGAVGVAAMLMAGTALAVPVTGQGTWETTLLGRDIGGHAVDASSDSAVFLYDTTLDITWLRDANVNGKMTNGAAGSWAQYSSFGGYYDWRLPTMDGEMAHLWYAELGNTAGGPMTNTGNFQNLQSDSYWLDSPPTWSTRYAFSTVDGSQNEYRRGLPFINFYAMAVRPGDVSAVPEPETGAMMLLALGGAFAVVVRRRPR